MQALIFDFDGIILDTELPDFESWQEVYREHGVELPRQKWDSIVGGNATSDFDPFDFLEEQIGRRVDRQSIDKQRREREMAIVLQLPVMPGVEDYLRAARRMGSKVAIGSSSPTSWVLPLLDHIGLSREFDCVVTADDVAKTKPDPEIYNLVLKRLGVDAGKCIVLEDSPNGITAAKAANIYCVCIPNVFTAHLNISHADLILHSLKELPLEALLQRLDGRFG